MGTQRETVTHRIGERSQLLTALSNKPVHAIMERGRTEGMNMAQIETLILEGTPQPPLVDPMNAASIALLKSWIAEAPTDPEEIRAAEEELREFKRNMNLPRKEAGARLLYPEVE